MTDIGPGEHRRLTRRALIKGGLIAGGVIGGAGAAIKVVTDASGGAGGRPRTAPTARTTPRSHQTQPNILVILVDQMRFPQWFSAAPYGSDLPPNLRRLSQGAVSFARHYAVSNDCTPSRAALLTGLYTHQTGCMITGGSTLDPGFPTWGTMLREHGYDTRWYGKWHLTRHDNLWHGAAGEAALERYGFAGGGMPSPDGAPGQGWRKDPLIAARFRDWFAQAGGAGPWCTTVSFVNPHDIAWWYVWTNRVAAEASVPRLAVPLPPNFETPEQLAERMKPHLQRSLQATAATSFGPVPFHGPEAAARWSEFMSLYAHLQLEVDAHIGAILGVLDSRPDVAANTVVIFTSDHGEYAASHGLRGKGAGVYEEGIRVPLIVRDPRGRLTAASTQARRQLSSHVDVAPLLLTIATGSSAWREDPHYEHLAGRLDLAAILADPGAPGRPYVVHATDEIVTEFAIEPYTADAPLHVTAIRTPNAKYATYSHWSHAGIEELAAGQEAELYDYSTHEGRLEIANGAGSSPLEARLHQQLARATADELRAPLPASMRGAQQRGFANYFTAARRSARAAAAMRKHRSERLVGHLLPGDTAGEAQPGRP
jgi:arylsulfatase A-like enzyme